MSPETVPAALVPIGAGAPSLAEVAYERILAAVLDGGFGPGDRLIMDRLAEDLGISRTPVRDALRRMESDGLVEAATKGFVIRTPGIDDVRAMYQAREPVEGWAVRMVAARSDEAAGPITAALDRLAEASGTALPGSEAYRANRDFHRAVVEAAGNPVVVDCFDAIWGRGLAALSFAESARHGTTVDVDEHRLLADAVLSGDPDRAEAEMLAHIRRGVGSV